MQRLLLSPKFIVPTLILAIIYLVTAIYMMNIPLMVDTIFGSFPLSYKATLMFDLLGGMWTAITHTELIILTLTALLTGANLTLLFIRLSSLRASKNIHFVIGGSSLLGIVGSGCAACGLPVLSLLGLTGSIVYLPFGGNELAYISLALLIFSFYTLTRSPQEAQSCLINPNISKI